MVWSGAADPYIDQIPVESAERGVVGVCGGSPRAGACKNEDGALVWAHPDGEWEFAAVLNGARSVSRCSGNWVHVAGSSQRRRGNPPAAFGDPLEAIVDALSSLDLGSIRGETSCPTFARKDCYVWWLKVRDCVLHVLHPDDARLGRTPSTSAASRVGRQCDHCVRRRDTTRARVLLLSCSAGLVHGSVAAIGAGRW